MKKLLKDNQKRLLVAAIPVFALIAIGVTIAYSHDRAIISDKMQLPGYKTLFTETFDAPQNWMTCDTIDKIFTVTNDSDSSGPIAVRVKLEEQWLASDGTTELPLISAASSLTMAQITFPQNSGWTKEGSYYYYDTDLAKGATTNPLMTAVTLNCDANIDALTGADKLYGDATYHLKITAQSIEAENKDSWTDLHSIITAQANSAMTIDYSRGAKISDDPVVANGNGINPYTEKGQTVYYYRGQIPDNNIIWSNICWKIVRTTYTGGIKIVYNGVPTVVDGTRQCRASASSSYSDIIHSNYSTFDRQYTNVHDFPINYYEQGHPSEGTFADSGYMYNEKIYKESITAGSTVFTFSNGVTRNGDSYTLDTSEGAYIAGTASSYSSQYPYFCLDGATTCDEANIAIIYSYSSYYDAIYYCPLGGYDDYADLRENAFENVHDSIAKTAIEGWFVANGLDAHENELEDAIFCNDRSVYSASATGATFTFYYRRYAPILDCPLQRDAFTKSDTTNGNGKLGHKVGLLTADEFTLAGMNNGDMNSYLTSSWYNWTMTPQSSGTGSSNRYYVMGSTYMFDREIFYDKSGFRPSVSLKAGIKVGVSGDGTKENPYVVEQ